MLLTSISFEPHHCSHSSLMPNYPIPATLEAETVKPLMKETLRRKTSKIEEEELDICMIGAAAFMTDTQKKLEGKVFSTSMKEVDELIAWHARHKGQELSIVNINAEADLISESELRKLVPEEYHDLLC